MPPRAPVLFPDASHLHHMMLQRELFISRATLNKREDRRVNKYGHATTHQAFSRLASCHGQSRPTKNPKELPRDSLQASTNKHRKRIPSYLKRTKKPFGIWHGYFGAVLWRAHREILPFDRGHHSPNHENCGAVNLKERSYFV